MDWSAVHLRAIGASDRRRRARLRRVLGGDGHRAPARRRAQSSASGRSRWRAAAARWPAARWRSSLVAGVPVVGLLAYIAIGAGLSVIIPLIFRAARDRRRRRPRAGRRHDDRLPRPALRPADHRRGRVGDLGPDGADAGPRRRRCPPRPVALRRARSLRTSDPGARMIAPPPSPRSSPTSTACSSTPATPSRRPGRPGRARTASTRARCTAASTAGPPGDVIREIAPAPRRRRRGRRPSRRWTSTGRRRSCCRARARLLGGASACRSRS